MGERSVLPSEAQIKFWNWVSCAYNLNQVLPSGKPVVKHREEIEHLLEGNQGFWLELLDRIWSITSWEIDGETMETVSDLILGGSKITADGDCSHEIKRRLLLGRKIMTNLDSTLKRRDITLSTKVHLVNAMVFPVVMYGCESRTVKKAERQKIDAFELWCWRRLLRVPWTARRSVLGVHWKDWCWSWNSNTLATSCEELTHWKRPWCWEGYGAGGEGDEREWDGWMASPTQWTWVCVNSRSWWWTARPGVLRFMESQSWTRLNWTELDRSIAN